jgi:transcriptional regulator with XRE-family HTH domain
MISSGKELKLKRIKNNISQKDFAEIIGISKTHLSFVENEKRKSYKVMVLATNYFENLENKKGATEK